MFYVIGGIVCSVAVVVTVILSRKDVSIGSIPLCPKPKNSDRYIKETIKYAELIPYREET